MRRSIDKASAGFTLLELLVTISIIVVLLGILIPVISRVRTAAEVVSTKSRISALIQAIQQYQYQFSALPGPIPEDALNSQPKDDAKGLVDKSTSAAVRVTSAQNLVLGLLGGLDFDGSTVSFYYSASLLGVGPRSLYATMVTPSVGAPYLLVKPHQFSPSMSFDPAMLSNGGLDSYLSTGAFTDIPEFVDSFPSPMPILYMRSSPGQTKELENNSSLGTIPRTAQYNLYTLSPYSIGDGDTYTFAISNSSPNDPSGFTGSYAYFNNPSLNVVQDQDGYILLSAGPDRKYGTADDINNFDFSFSQ